MNLKLMVVSGYILSVAAWAVAAGATSGARLIVFTALALLPAGALLTLWTHASQTMSEAIQAARR